MWGRKKDKPLQQQLSHQQAHPTSLLSISTLARQQHGLDSCWATPRSGRASVCSGQGLAATAGSASCTAGRPDGLYEVVSQHEQLLQALSDRVLAVEDCLDKLQADVMPSLQLVSTLCKQQQQLQDSHFHQSLGAPGTVNCKAQPVSPIKCRQPGGAVGAAGSSNAASAAATASLTVCAADAVESSCKDQQHQDVPGDAAAASTTADGDQPPGAAAAEAGSAWPELCHSLSQMDKAVSRALADIAGLRSSAAAAGVGHGDRDDIISVRSFSTCLSYGSTQVSAPAMMTDLRPSTKAPSRAQHWCSQQQQLQQQQQGSMWLMADAAAGGGAAAASALDRQTVCADQVGLGGSCSSWPLQLGVHEEASTEEIQAMITAICSNSSSTSKGSSDGQQQQQQQQALEQQCEAISCLALHAERDEEVRVMLCTPELLQRVTEMLQGPHLACCQAAVHLVWYISRSDSLRQSLYSQPQLLPVLLSLLASQDAATARAAAFTINNLAHEQACRLAMVEAGAVASLIDMLSGCDALGQEAAAAALMMLASEEGSTCATIVACNGVQALVQVLRYGGPAAQEAAASALENLSLDAACEAALAAEGAVEGLLQVLQDGTVGARAAAAGTLRNLAVNDELEVHLLAAGTVPVLLGLVGSSREEVGVRTAALEALRNLAANSTQSGDALIQAGGAAILVEAARSLPAAAARSAALAALLVLSMDEKHRRAIMAAGVAGVMVHAALAGSPTSKEYAARSLANLAAVEQNRAELLREGAATVLTFLLKSQLAAFAATATCSASASPASSQAGPPATVTQQQDEQQEQVSSSRTANLGCCLAAARALQNLAKHMPACKQLIDAGCIPPLVTALLVPGPVASAAVSALGSLCISRRAMQEAAESGACSRLVAAAAKPKHLTARGQRHALRLLKRLVKGAAGCQESVQEQVAALGLQL